MERKIGEIFEVDGQWYQCVQGNCEVCDFSRDEHTCLLGVSNCVKFRRNNDCKAVAFKKLEKVGEPYFNDQYGEVLQEYKYYIPPITPDLRIHIIRLGIVGIEIKQNKEDMEEGKLDPHMEKVIDEAAQKLGDEISKQLKENLNKQRMKPFNLEAAKAGKPVCTRDGRKARIICFDAKGDKPIIALVKMGTAETPNNYPIDGKAVSAKEASCDLMMLPEKKEGWVNIYHDKEGNIYTDENVYNTEKDAINFCPHDKCRVATVKIEWEE